MRWIVVPLAAALALSWSGFLDRLDATTVASAELARASEEAPQATGQAAEEVQPLPAIADLTTRQADAFDILGDALEVSARRVTTLNDTLSTQASGVTELVGGIDEIRGVLGCVGKRLTRLLRTSRGVPERLGEIATILRHVEAIQRKSIRHLKSINRKMTALGAAAKATDVKAPAPPEIPSIELPRAGSTPVDC